jgi:outer membrane protein insertion porin family
MSKSCQFEGKARIMSKHINGARALHGKRSPLLFVLLSIASIAQPVLATIDTKTGEGAVLNLGSPANDAPAANATTSPPDSNSQEEKTSSAASGTFDSASNTSDSASNASPTDNASAQSSSTFSDTRIGASANPNLTVDDVKVEGNRLVAAEDIMSVVKTKRGDKYDRETVMQDLKAINNMGYFDDRNLQVVPELTSGGVLLKIRVQENAPITQFGFEGNTVLSTDEIQKSFVDQLGKPQNLGSLSAAIDKVEQTYHERGFVLARVTDVKDDPDGSVGLKINEGLIDKIEIAGNKRTKDFIIRNAIRAKAGAVYNEHQLTADLRKLYANGYFQDVKRSLSPSSENPDHYVLKVEVEEKRTASVGVGGGIDTVAGPFGSLNISDSNFQGRGQVLSFNSQIGSGMLGSLNNTLNNGGRNFVANQSTYMAELSFIEPNLFGTNTSASTSLFGRDFNSMTITQSMQRSLGISQTFTKSLGHHVSASLGLTADNTWFKDVSSLFQNQDIMLNMMSNAIATGQASTPSQAAALAASTRALQLKGGAYAMVSPTLAYDTRDAKIDPTHGTYLRVSATPSLGLTNASFLKLGASASKFFKVNDSITFATNAQAGTGFGGMPQFGMFNLGGMNGIRGYRSFTDLGMGTGMLMGTAEIRTKLPFLSHSDSKFVRAIGNHVKGTIFADAGQVVGNNQVNSLMGRSNMGASVGVGLRFNLPMVGLVRVDYGLPLLSSVMGGRFYPRINIGFGERF